MPDHDSDEIQRWSTDDVPPEKRLDFFAAAVSEALNPFSVDNTDAHNFRAEVTAADLGPVGICKVASSAHGVYRRQHELARITSHNFSLVMTLRTPWTADHRGALRLMPRDILIVDSRYPLVVDVPESVVAINVTFTEPWLRQWLPDPDRVATQHISGNSLWGLALSSYVSELTPELVAAPPLPLAVMADQVGSLLALAASGLDGAARTGPGLRSLRQRIHDCLMQRCAEPNLTASEVATSLSISVRTLHRALAAAGETFGATLIGARASVALRMLSSPLFKRVTTTEIAHRSGFASISHFARVIRRRTGMSPLTYRRSIQTDAADRELRDRTADAP